MDGTDIRSITPVEITWSCHLFFLSAAKIPSPSPIGTPISEEYTFISTVGGRRETNASHTGALIYPGIFTPIPKSPSVKILFT